MKAAETTPGCEPAVIPARLTPLIVATPLASVDALPAGDPLNVNAIDLLATGDVPEVSVARSVVVPPYSPVDGVTVNDVVSRSSKQIDTSLNTGEAVGSVD